MKFRHLLTLLATGSLLSVASAQYLGSNDFSSGTGGGSQYSLPGNVGTFTVEQGRLEYSAASTNSTRVLPMNSGINSAYTEDWTASLSLTNLAAPTSGFNLISLQVFSSNAEYGFFNVGLYRTASGNSGVLFEKGKTTDGTVNTYSFTSYIAAESDFTDVLVRMSHNSTTKDITLAYSLDSGATYLDTTTFNPNLTGGGVSAGNWYAAPTDGYSFRILGRNSVDTPIAGDLMYADDFSVVAGATAMTAIPEPSTYAGLAGLGALGLVLWRRRQAKSAA
jgi:PEP-CTERM motif